VTRSGEPQAKQNLAAVVVVAATAATDGATGTGIGTDTAAGAGAGSWVASIPGGGGSLVRTASEAVDVGLKPPMKGAASTAPANTASR